MDTSKAQIDKSLEKEFLSVIRSYERVIYKVCYLYTTPNATLNDLYQEVVLNIWKAFPKFRAECKISTWIYRIALNTCISFIRKEKRTPEYVLILSGDHIYKMDYEVMLDFHKENGAEVTIGDF